MTGKVGGIGVGVLNVLTNEFIDSEVYEPRTNYSVVRVNNDISNNSTVGVILINKKDADTFNRTTGLDFSYQPVKTVDIRGLWARTFD